MPIKKKTAEDKKRKKFDLWKRIWGAVEKYQAILVINSENVGSSQFQDIRESIRPLEAEMIMGKGSLLRKALKMKLRKPEETDIDYEYNFKNYVERPELEKLIGVIKGRSGLIFTNHEIDEIRQKLALFVNKKGAKNGVQAPCDVWLKAGPTGLDPKQTTLFQALNIQTKIVKTQIDINSDTKICTKGKMVGYSECTLLDKLGIKPFIYTAEIKHVLEGGNIYGGEALEIKSEEIVESLKNGILNLTAISVEENIPNELSIQQMIASGFKNLLAIGLNSDYEFKEAKLYKESLSLAAQVIEKPTEIKKEVEVVEVKKVIEEKKEDDFAGGINSLFGDD